MKMIPGRTAALFTAFALAGCAHGAEKPPETPLRPPAPAPWHEEPLDGADKKGLADCVDLPTGEHYHFLPETVVAHRSPRARPSGIYFTFPDPVAGHTRFIEASRFKTLVCK